MVSIAKQPHDKCGAKTRDGGKCQLKAGWGTDHVGKGRCKLHGGASKGPGKGNKNAVKHGVYEQVIREHLDEEQRETFDKVSDEDDLRNELKILRFKLLRLLEPQQQQELAKSGKVANLDIDEVTKSKAIAKLVDNIRKLVKDMNDLGKSDDDSLQGLVEVLQESRDK